MTLPADIVNRALDAIGVPNVIGDLEEGTREAQVALRAYGPAMRQLLGAAHWDFCRKQAPLTLLADATGQSEGVGSIVVPPWCYEYSFPIDCIKSRFVPMNNVQGQTGSGATTTLAEAITDVDATVILVTSLGNFPLSGQYVVTIDDEDMTVYQGQGTLRWTVGRAANDTTPATHLAGATVTMVAQPPLMTGLTSISPNGNRLIPARFLVTSDYNYPVTSGTYDSWQDIPQWWLGLGEGPQQRTVIVTNVKDASLVYSALMIYPDQWDQNFTEALVQLLAARLAMPLVEDKKFALTVRRELVGGAKDILRVARANNANESGFPQDTDHIPDFMRIRVAGAGWGGYSGDMGGPGFLYCGWDAIGWPDGSVF